MTFRSLQCNLHRLYISDSAPAMANATAISVLASALTSAGNASVAVSTGAQHALRAEANSAASGSKVHPTERLSRPYEGFPWRKEVDFLGKDLSTHTNPEDTITITESGVYSLWFVICVPTLEHVRTLLIEKHELFMAQ
jgi:hypothetical protein